MGEELIPYNKYIQSCSKKLYTLRGIEHSVGDMNDKWEKASPLLSQTCDILKKRHNFVLYRVLWEELHDRMVYYYDYLNQNALSSPIPLFRVTLHNEASDWWIKAKEEGKIQGPLIHFDTHDDMGLFKYLDNQECQRINHPVTCALFYDCTGDAIWGMPEWIYDHDYSCEQIICRKGKSMYYLRSDGEKKDRYRIGDVDIVKAELLKKEKVAKKYDWSKYFYFDRVHISSLRTWKKLASIIRKREKGKKNKKFILDIDLDFFVSNGDKIKKEVYKKDFLDIQSYGRVHTFPGIKEPRESYNDRESLVVVSRLNKEAKKIKKRVKAFLSGLRYLKRNNILPSVIDISDSSNSLFSGRIQNAVMTNEYTPKYFVPFLHCILVKEIEKLYY